MSSRGRNTTNELEFQGQVIADQTTSFEDERLRIKLVQLTHEKEALAENPMTPRNWSKFMRAPLSYYKLFKNAA